MGRGSLLFCHASPHTARQAHPLPQGEVQMCHAADATPPSSSKKGRATSRVYEAFKQDPTDNSRYICQSTEDVVGGGVCNDSCVHSTSTMWTHLKAKHPLHWQTLKGFHDPDDDIRISKISEGGCTIASCSAHVSYKQMVKALSQAPPETLTWAIEELTQAERRQMEMFANAGATSCTAK